MAWTKTHLNFVLALFSWPALQHLFSAQCFSSNNWLLKKSTRVTTITNILYSLYIYSYTNKTKKVQKPNMVHFEDDLASNLIRKQLTYWVHSIVGNFTHSNLYIQNPKCKGGVILHFLQFSKMDAMLSIRIIFMR